MIEQSADNFQCCENAETFRLACKDLGLFRMLVSCGFRRKHKGPAVSAVLFTMLMQIFCFRNLYQRLQSRWGSLMLQCGKDVYYDFMNNPYFNWTGLCIKLAASFIKKLNLPACRKTFFILDDTIMPRPRAKQVELCARIFDHVFQRYVKGFTNLTLAWTDGISAIPVCFSLMSSKFREKRMREADSRIDGRSHGARIRREAVKDKPSMAISLLQRAIKAGISADYVLMDTWFTNETMLLNLQGIHLHAIGMVKDLRQRYLYNGREYRLKELGRLVLRQGQNSGDIKGAVEVTTRRGLKVKIAVIANRCRPDELLYILSTDTALSAEEIVRFYSLRFKIEHCFKAMKHHLSLTKETQCRCFDSTFAFTALSVIRLIVLEWIIRGSEDLSTIGELFARIADEFSSQPMQETAGALLDLMESIPQLLVKDGIITAEQAATVAMVISREFKNVLDKRSRFVAEFIQGCRKACNDPLDGSADAKKAA